MKNLFLATLSILLLNTLGIAQAQSPAPTAGKDYTEIPNGSPLEPADGSVVVEEFFNYICPACYSFEPQFASWAGKLPDYVKLVHIPAAFRADFVQYAKAYYAAQAFGVADESHWSVYDAIHRTHALPAEGDRVDEERIAAFYADNYGVDEKKFLATMRSFGVDLKIRRATEHMQRSRVTGTPTLVVNGRYLVRGATYADMLQTASYLIEQEHAR